MGGIKIVKSNRKHKKYVAVVDGKMVHFGDTRYGQYKDQIGVYSGKLRSW
jgi:capsid portal protein